MEPTVIDAIQEEIRTQCDGAIVTNIVAVVEFFDPADNMRTLVTLGAGADGEPITPWMASGMLDAACNSGIRHGHAVIEDDESE